MRKHGLTVDNVLAYDVVTADGAWVRADADHHPDLYWALRGGGSAFGVVTHFTYRLHPGGPLIYGGFLGWPIAQSMDVFHAAQAALADAPEELWVQFIWVTGPEGFMPPGLAGEPCLVVTATWIGVCTLASRFSTSLAILITSISTRPQEGQETKVTPRERSSSERRIS